jgi:hypothetical protein
MAKKFYAQTDALGFPIPGTMMSHTEVPAVDNILEITTNMHLPAHPGGLRYYIRLDEKGAILPNSLFIHFDVIDQSDVVSLQQPNVVIYTVGQSALGGVIAYILQPGDAGYDPNVQHGLVTTSGNVDTGAIWGCVGTAIPGAAGTAIGTGYQNTLDIVAGCNFPFSAAAICNDLDEGGYTDWFLPSKDELNKLYLNRTPIGGFVSFYLSSTEAGDDTAWGQNFTNGVQFGYPKDQPMFVRAIRTY